MLEIGKILHARGHTIDFATLEGGQKAVNRFSYVENVHFLGRNLTPEEDENMYVRASGYRPGTVAGSRDAVYFKIFLGGFWRETYPNLKRLVSQIHYDFMISDHLCDATKDISIEDNIPLALVWPQAPFMLAPHPWIPGDPYLQVRCLTSEHASMYDRVFEMTGLVRAFPWFLYAVIVTTVMRWKGGVKRMERNLQRKPDYLVLINSFFGLEIPKDLPPLISCVGPILPDAFSPLDGQTQRFLNSHPRTAFIAFGTHIRLPFDIFERLFAGLSATLAAGDLDGVIWALSPASRRQVDLNKRVKSLSSKVTSLTYGEYLSGANPAMSFVDYAPQRAVLSHPSTRVFVTHCGASSANEGAYHGVPMLALGIYFDQIPGALRLCAAGVALPLKKFSFTPEEVRSKIATIVEDQDGLFARNCLRLKRIALIASKGKERAADLVEEHMYDHELRFDRTTSKASSPMHLQTADMRISLFKKHNLDILCAALLAVGGIVVLLNGLGIGQKK